MLTPLAVPPAPVDGSVVAVLLAVAAAVLFGLATVRQHAAVQRLPDAGGLRPLLSSPGWLGGGGQTVVAGALHLTALALAPIALVQPLGVLAVPVAVVAHARRARRRPTRQQLVGSALSVLGTGGLTLTLLLATGGTTTSAPVLPGPATVLVLSTAALAVPLLALLGRWVRPPTRVVVHALTGAILFGLTSVLVRTAVTAWDLARPAVTLSAIVGAAVLAAAGLVAVQRAHRTGSPSLVVCCLTLVDPVVAAAGAGVLLGETSGLGAGTAASAALCFVLAALGVVLLARDHPAVRPPPSTPAEPAAPALGHQPPAPVLTRSTS